MKNTKTYENHIATFVMAVAVCFAFFSLGLQAVQAEEVDGTTNTDSAVVEKKDKPTKPDMDGEKRASMMKQIESLKAMLAERKAQMQQNHQERVEAKKEAVAEKKEAFKLDKEAFMAGLVGLDEEAKRAAMLDFISKIREAMEAKKAEMVQHKTDIKVMHTEMKETRVTDREAFQASLEGLSKEEKLAAIMERVATIKQQMQDRIEADKAKKEAMKDEAEVDEDEDEEEES